MPESFIVLEFNCNWDLSEILIAELSLHGYESFLEKENGFECSIEKNNYDAVFIRHLFEKYQPEGSFSVSRKTIDNENWNKVWENNFLPVVVENKVLVRAPFHKVAGKYQYEIIIQPQMSFGTGHHETTYMMIRAMLDLDLTRTKVLDAGCGSGILSVTAEKFNASSVIAVDIDEWAITNTSENAALNHCHRITIHRTPVDKLPDTGFNIILANINRNVLLEAIPGFSGKMCRSGILLVSGFYNSDNPLIERRAESNQFRKVRQYERNHWSAIVFEKKTD